MYDEPRGDATSLHEQRQRPALRVDKGRLRADPGAAIGPGAGLGADPGVGPGANPAADPGGYCRQGLGEGRPLVGLNQILFCAANVRGGGELIFRDSGSHLDLLGTEISCASRRVHDSALQTTRTLVGADTRRVNRPDRASPICSEGTVKFEVK